MLFLFSFSFFFESTTWHQKWEERHDLKMPLDSKTCHFYSSCAMCVRVWLLNGHKTFLLVASDPQKDPSVYDNNLQQCFTLFRSSFYCILNSEFTCPQHNSPKRKSMITSNIERNILFYLSPLYSALDSYALNALHCALRTKIVRCAMHGWIHIIMWYAFIVWLLAAHKNENKSFMISSFSAALIHFTL